MHDFLKRDLLGSYNWPLNGNDNPKLKDEPDDSEMDRQNGFEILYLIKKIMQAHACTSIDQGHEIERMIMVAPAHLKTQREIMEWIERN